MNLATPSGAVDWATITSMENEQAAKNKENVRPHPHMRCVHCDRIICLPALPGDYLQCLDKYKIDPSQFYAEGVCQDCSTKEKQSYQKK
jgi:Fe2+ or Zn2+ uptake regulation protein